MVTLKRNSRLSVLLVLVAVGACSIDDRNLSPHDGDAGDAGDAGDDSGGTGGSSGDTSGGTAGKGGSGTTGGTAGKGGSSTTGGTAGKGGSTSGGTSGKGGSGAFGGTEDCDGDALEVDEDLVRACLMQVGCNPFVPSVSLSFCITNQRLNTFSQDDCGTGATSCDEYLACRGQGYYDGADCTSGDAVYCEDETLGVACSRYPYAIDCAKFGGTCATYTDDTDEQRVWCKVPGHDTCTEPEGMKQCDAAGISYQCIDGVAFGNDCDLIGSECRDGTCYYVLPACTTPGVTCGSATRVDVCYDSEDLARYQCAPGLGCEESATSANCLAPGCTATSPCTESCDGTELTFCYGGVPVTLDCTDYGFRRCIESTPTAGEDPLAFCGIPASAVDTACEVQETDTTCGACAKTECCPAWTACLDNPDCIAYRGCVNACAESDTTCIEGCGDMYPLGLASSDAFFACRLSACSC
jgi:hypothetical protein